MKKKTIPPFARMSRPRVQHTPAAEDGRRVGFHSGGYATARQMAAVAGCTSNTVLAHVRRYGDFEGFKPVDGKKNRWGGPLWAVEDLEELRARYAALLV